MFDILPASEEPSESPRRKPATVSSQSQKPAVIHAGPRVVELQWQLPSRLRKPIREQLQRERAEKRRRKAAAVTFARKSINTQPLLVADADSKRPGMRVRKPRRFFNRGVEHNTGDVYSQGKPQLHVAAPPYVGHALATRAPKQSAPAARQAPPSRAVPRPVRKRPMRQKPRQRFEIAERDVPMRWQQAGASELEPQEELFAHIEKPRKIRPAVTFSLWPGNWFGKGKQDSGDVGGDQEYEPVVASQTSKKKRLIW